MLQAATPQTIRATVAVIEQHADAISQSFYHLLFNQHPHLQHLFSSDAQAIQRQQRALARALIACARNIDQLERLDPALTKIARTHCRHGVLPAHYGPVGECLITAIAQVLGPAATDAVLAAWADTYLYLSSRLIKAEHALYQVGGSGTRP